MTIVSLAAINNPIASQNFLFALAKSLNMYSVGAQVAVATAGTNSTLTATQFLRGSLVLSAGASGGFTITLPSTASLILALGGAAPIDGNFSIPVFIQNLAVGQTGTLTAGDGSTTLSGTMTIATNTTRLFLVTVASGTTLTILNLGSLAV